MRTIETIRMMTTNDDPNDAKRLDNWTLFFQTKKLQQRNLCCVVVKKRRIKGINRNHCKQKQFTQLLSRKRIEECFQKLFFKKN